MLLYGEHKQEQLISWIVWNHGGEEALKLGLGYVVGNGQDIAVWSDPWLSSTEVSTPIGPLTLSTQHLKVADLLDHSTNSWDLTKIRQELPLYEETIRQIIPSSLQPPDKRVWLGEKNGIYSTKSGYRLMRKKVPHTGDSATNWMKLIWEVHIPPKIRFFLWRAAKDALPVGSLLATRGVRSELNCKRCGDEESILHIFFDCDFARRIWQLAPISPLSFAGLDG